MKEPSFSVHAVGIVGMGSLGGSFAKAIHAREEHCHIYCTDQSMEALLLAESDGLTDDFLDRSAAHGSDLILLTDGAAANAAWLDECACALRPGTVVANCGGSVAEGQRTYLAERDIIYVQAESSAFAQCGDYSASGTEAFKGAKLHMTAVFSPELREGLKEFFLSLGFTVVQ